MIAILGLWAVQTAWADTMQQAGFDHVRWDTLLKAHVYPIKGDGVTVVDYQGMSEDRQILTQYLSELFAVSQTQFDAWSEQEQLAFLINAYNAWTVELILTAWPNLESIKELGGLFSSPWSKQIVLLLGKTRSLDDIEHVLIRGSGRYDDPRIHFAVNCASIGCPALRAQAYSGDDLDQQLDQQATLFLGDRSRNRVDGTSIMLSAIFKWYREDFEKGWQGFNRLEDFLLKHSEALGVPSAMAQNLQTGDADIEFLDYDWRLNKKS